MTTIFEGNVFFFLSKDIATAAAEVAAKVRTPVHTELRMHTDFTDVRTSFWTIAR